MYFHLVYSPEFFAVAFRRKSTRKHLRQATKLMVLIHHVFVGKYTSPPFDFISCPFHMGILLPLGKRLIKVFLETQGCKKPKSKSCANANSVYL